MPSPSVELHEILAIADAITEAAQGFLPRVKTRPSGYLYRRGSHSPPLRGNAVRLAKRVLFGFLAREGMRTSEALTLAWSELDTR